MGQAAGEPAIGLRPGALRDIPSRDLLIRFGFGAAISAIAAWVAIVAGSGPGGILLAFPAILPATLTLVEREEGERKAEDLDVGAVLGALALAPFALVIWQYVDTGSAPLVLALGTIAWLVASVLLYLGFRCVHYREVPLHKSSGELRNTSKRGRR